MPIKIPNQLPATQTLRQENIFVMTKTRAITQDIRPLRILPDLEDTELGKIHITAFSDDRQYANSLLATVTFHIDPTDEQLTAYQTRWAETHESEPSREYASSTISTDFTYSITADASRSIAYLQALGYTLDRPLG